MPGPSRVTRELFWLLALALLLIGAGIGLRDPWPADEPRFVLVAQQMLASGDWLFPHRGQEIYADKPPLYFWLLAAAHWLTAGWRGSFLLPSLLAALVTVGLTWDLTRRLWGHEAARWAGGALLLCTSFVFHAKRAQIDPALVGLTTLSLYGLLRHLLLGPNWRWYLLGCFAAGLGVITKGVGFLPLLVLLPFALMRRAGWTGLAPIAPGQRGRWWLGALAFLGATSLWLLPLLWLALNSADPGHRAYLDEILFRQTAGRYADAWHHQQPPWYFLHVVAVSWLPFSLALPWLLRPWRRAWRQADARVWLPLAWALLVLLFFSLSSGKRDVYILPALPALAVAAAPFLSSVLDRAWPRRLLWALYALVALAAMTMAGWALLDEPGFALKLVASRGSSAGMHALWWLLLAIGFGLLMALTWFGTRRVVLAVLIGQLLLFGAYGFGLNPLLNGGSSAGDLMQRAREQAGPGIEIGLVGWREQNLLQAIGPVTEFGFSVSYEQQWQRGLAWLRDDPGQRMLFVRKGLGEDCLVIARTIDLGTANRLGWRLVPVQAIARECSGIRLQPVPAEVEPLYRHRADSIRKSE